MVWFWSSSSPPSPQEQPKAPSPSVQQAPAPATTAPADPEIQKLLHLFKTDDGEEPTKTQVPPPPPSPTASPSPDTNPPIISWLSLKASSRTNEPEEAPLLDPLSESLLPTDMSCRQAFDLAWSCNGVGGQFNAVYRYGNLRSCSELWDDFWFCMRTRSHTGTLKASMVKTYYRNKAYRKYGQGKPSSEDIWERRKEKLPPGSAFSIPVPVSQADISNEQSRAGDGEGQGRTIEER
ncbi:hypothetical protein E4U21_001779 [Claviceps maximensis]|nr:hypothetical protein E4U21_001779 [Claviceps maximensis]